MKRHLRPLIERALRRLPVARVSFAVIELWRIRKPAFDRAAFAWRVDAFPTKSIGMAGRPGTDAIMDYLAGDDWQHEDLYLWH